MCANNPSEIAVIGMACRYPGAKNARELWENILTKRQQFRQIPDVRLPLDEYYDPNPATADKTYGSRAALLDGFEVDPQRYRIPKATLAGTDIVHWLALVTALEAIEYSNTTLSPSIKEKAGVILGNTLTGEETRTNAMRLRWPFVRKTLRRSATLRGLSPAETTAFEETMEEVYKSVFPPTTEDSLAGGLSNTIAGRICNYLDFKGAGYTVDGACASSLLAVATAADYLQHGKLDLVVAGGVDVSLDTFELIGFSKATALTPDEMRVYDRRGNGFIPGEGCGMVVLKRLADAQRDGDTIFAVLKGWGVSSDGRGGITAPNANGQARALVKAYRTAGYAPQTLDFIEGHGTGTRVGDRTELEGIALAFAEFGSAAPHGVGVTSFKSICGHTKAAAGIGGFIKAVMAVNRRVLPPTAGCNEPHESFTTTAKGLFPMVNGAVKGAAETVRAGVSAMGFGGINCHVTLESGPSPLDALAPGLPEPLLLASFQQTELFPLAGHDAMELLQACQRLRVQADGASQAELVDLAADCSQRLAEKTYRAAVIAASIDELCRRLSSLEARLQEQPPKRGQVWQGDQIWIGHAVTANRVGLVFPGQGSQRVGMGRNVLQRFPWANRLAQRADRLVQTAHDRLGLNLGDPSTIRRYCAHDGQRDLDGSVNAELQLALRATHFAQPAICLNSWLWYLRLKSLGITPTAVGGHSLGELTALAAAGAYDAAELLQLATVRGWAMTLASSDAGAMAVVSCDASTAERLIHTSTRDYCVVANRNSPRQTVISGSDSAIHAVLVEAGRQGIATQPLAVSGAFHSNLMADAAERFRAEAIGPAVRSRFLCRVFSSRDGRALLPGMDLKRHLAEQIVAPVDFPSLVDAMQAECDWFVEVGPGRVLTNLIQQRDEVAGLACYPVESKANRDADLNAVVANAFTRGAAIRWDRLYANRLVRPFVPASRKQFYVNPCERLPKDDSVDAISRNRETDFPRRDPVVTVEPATPRLSGSAIQPQPLPNAAPPLQATPARAVLLDLLSDLTGFPAETLTDDLRLIDDLNLDSIKAGGLLAETKLRLGIAGSIETSRLVNADIRTIVTALQSPEADVESRLDVQDVLFDLVCQQTGFERSSLCLTQRLLDDLNVDSIKAAALIADLLLRTKTQGSIAASELLNATLGELTERVRAALPDHAAPASSIVSTPPKSRWVRAFGVRKRPLPAAPVNTPRFDAREESLAVLCATRHGFAASLAREFGADLLDGSHMAAASKRIRPATLVVVVRCSGELDEFDLERRGIQSLSIVADFARRSPDAWANLKSVIFVQCLEVAQNDAAGPSAKAFAASLQLERPNLEIIVIEHLAEHNARQIAQTIGEQIRGEPGYRFLGIGLDASLWTEEVTPVEPEECRYRGLRWSAHDVVLVTGGGKGITFECALAFARQTGVCLALLGRSQMPLSNDDGELGSGLRRLREEGIRFRYYPCDVGDVETLGPVLSRIRSELGPIAGVLHGAGVNQPRPVTAVSAEEALREISPKLVGAANLIRLLADDPLKMFAALTSIIGVTGMTHNAWYAYSNEAVARLLDSYARAHPDAAVTCFAFGVWDEVGMGVKLGSVKHLEQIGVQPIPVAEGVRHFLRWLENEPPTREVIVTASVNGLPTWPARPVVANDWRFEGDPIRIEAGIERVTRVTLDTATDLYLNDHDFRGSLLFPTVMGLEAMAQNALSVVGHSDLRVVRIETIRLDQPIVVARDRPLTIELRAMVAERLRPDEPWVVESSIATESSGFSQAHFSARVILDHDQRRPESAMASRPVAPLDIVPSTDLYGSVLFQGPLFQRICAIESLDQQQVQLLSLAVAEPSPASSGFAPSHTKPLVLGDAYYRDSLLQAVQLPLTPDICLPIYIDRIEFHADRPFQGRFRARSTIVRRAERRVGVDISVHDADGNLVERIAGYEVQILERRDDLPTPMDLLQPRARREQESLAGQISDLESKFGLVAPSAVIRKLPALHKRSRAERRALELPLFFSALRAAGERFGYATEELHVAWLNSGKPVYIPRAGSETILAESAETRVRRLGADGLDVSLSHDGDFALCVAAKGPQGTDLVAPQRHSREKWQAMLAREHWQTLGRLEAEGDTLDRAGARLWAALEALTKATGQPVGQLRIADRNHEAVLLVTTKQEGEVTVLTFPWRADNLDEYLVAMVVKPTRLPTAAASVTFMPAFQKAGARRHGESRLIGLVQPDHDEWRTLSAEELEQPTDRLRFRLPLSFKDGSNPDGTLNFVRSVEWMGRLREVMLKPVLPQLLDEFTSRRFAWVTNRSSVLLEKPVYAGEPLDVDVQLLDRPRLNDSTIALRFDWYRTGQSGGGALVAASEIEMTWAKTIGHGLVQPAPYPAYLNGFLRTTFEENRRRQADSDSHSGALDRLGSPEWRAQLRPDAGIRLLQHTLQTTQNDANLVGNIYFSKYYELQSFLLETYLFNLIPSAYTNEVNRGMRCLYATVDHLRDAMPFDKLTASMRLVGVFDRGIEVMFDFLRILPNGNTEKLAVGRQVVVWIDRELNSRAEGFGKMPLFLFDHFMKCAAQGAERDAA